MDERRIHSYGKGCAAVLVVKNKKKKLDEDCGDEEWSDRWERIYQKKKKE